MNFLIDTHIAIWAVSDDSKLSKITKDILTDERNEIYYSTASIWEIIIKHMAHPEKLWSYRIQSFTCPKSTHLCPERFEIPRRCTAAQRSIWQDNDCPGEGRKHEVSDAWFFNSLLSWTVYCFSVRRILILHRTAHKKPYAHGHSCESIRFRFANTAIPKKATRKVFQHIYAPVLP